MIYVPCSAFYIARDFFFGNENAPYWKLYKKRRENMKITLKDGSVKEYASAMSVIDSAKDISEGLARAACAGEVDGKVVDLRTVIS